MSHITITTADIRAIEREMQRIRIKPDRDGRIPIQTPTKKLSKLSKLNYTALMRMTTTQLNELPTYSPPVVNKALAKSRKSDGNYKCGRDNHSITNCALCTTCTHCHKCTRAVNCDECCSCNQITDCQNCTSCIGCCRCCDCQMCLQCIGCIGCNVCDSCVDCWYCVGINRQVGRQYAVYGVQLTERQYSAVALKHGLPLLPIDQIARAQASNSPTTTPSKSNSKSRTKPSRK